MQTAKQTSSEILLSLRGPQMTLGRFGAIGSFLPTKDISPLRRSRRGDTAKVEEYAPGVSEMSEGPPAPEDIFRHDGYILLPLLR